MELGYQLKITIKGSHPPIWRRVIVPGKINFQDLDDIIEDLFGWTHGHLYEFCDRKSGRRFQPSDDEYFWNTESVENLIDDCFIKGEKWTYTYDFGDDWVHDILVEDVVPYKERFAKVLKSKGPYMIEDCGGLWGFYESYIDEAEPFDIEIANHQFEQFPIEAKEFVQIGEDYEYSGTPEGDWGEFGEDSFGQHMKNMLEENPEEILQQYFSGLQNSRNTAEEWIEENKEFLSRDFYLKDVYSSYTKDDLKWIAQMNGFSGYSKLKKSELADWLVKKMLEENHMAEIVEDIIPEEGEVIQLMINQPEGIWITESAFEQSFFLSCYGAFHDEAGVMRLPKDVREMYQNVNTTECQKRRLEKDKICKYCNSAVELYGVVPISEVAVIYRHYTGKDILVKQVKKIALEYMKDNRVTVRGRYLVHMDIDDEDMELILEDQEGNPYYVPDTEEEFLIYGNADEETIEQLDEVKFSKWLEEELNLDVVCGFTIAKHILLCIKLNYEEEALMEILDVLAPNMGIPELSTKQKRKVKKKLSELCENTRLYSYSGHTLNEIVAEM